MFWSSRPQSPPDRQQMHRAHQRALVSEARMMVDFLASHPSVSLNDVKARAVEADAPAKCRDIDPCEMLTLINAFDRRLDRTDADNELSAAECATLQLIRDALTEKARPATGMTIAFSAMVAGQRRGRASQSRLSLAEDAYPALRGAAIGLRRWYYFLIGFAIVITLAAGWQATKVALGKSLMQRLESLRIEQRTLHEETARLEAALTQGLARPDALAPFLGANSDGAATRVHAFAMCDQPIAAAWELSRRGKDESLPTNPAAADSAVARVVASLVPAMAYVGGEKLKLYGSPPARDVCEHDRVLAYSFGIVHYDLRQFEADWPRMAGAFYVQASFALDGLGGVLDGVGDFAGNIVRCPFRHAGDPDNSFAPDGRKMGFWRCLGHRRATPAAFGPSAIDTTANLPPGDDVEFMIAPKLIVWGNYVLPVIFGVLGSAIYAILDLYGRMRESRLEPRDLTFSMMRLVLGLVTGACVGLFFSTYGPNGPSQATNLIESLTLSAAGLAFLAGFGVEGVFNFLQSLVTRVFPVQDAARR